MFHSIAAQKERGWFEMGKEEAGFKRGRCKDASQILIFYFLHLFSSLNMASLYILSQFIHATYIYGLEHMSGVCQKGGKIING